VVVDLGAQVEDDALADACRIPPLDQRQERVGAMSSAIQAIEVVAPGPPLPILLITSPASTGVATPITAPNTTVTRKTVMSSRYGRANSTIRRAVPRLSR
jgi:hypothetical protein